MRAHRGDHEVVVRNHNGAWSHTLPLCATCDSPLFVARESLPEGDVSKPTQLQKTLSCVVSPSTAPITESGNRSPK